jgi:flagellar basal-body rod modification protein FlgD
MVTAVDSTGTATATASAGASQSLSKNFDSFLKLLVAQLQNQDPLAPMDSSEFTSQLVQFSGVEQAINTNKNLENLLGLTQTNFNSSLVGYLGKEVTFRGDTAPLRAGKAEWTYTLPEAAAATELKVLDAGGRIVWRGPGAITAGAQAFAWDGRGVNGETLPEGIYRLAVDARSGADAAIAASIVVRGTVTGLATEAGTTRLNVDGRNVPIDQVQSVRMVASPNGA